MFYSSRNKKEVVSSSKALINGLASDGGLYLIDKIPELKIDEKILKMDYQELAIEILSKYFEDFTKEEVSYCVRSAYTKENFENEPVGVKSFKNHSFLELFNGPTIAFKDMALTLLPYLLEVAMKKQGVEKLKILTATSGDTGSAALSSLSKVDNISISVLYPHHGISAIQEKQMLYFTNQRARAYALENGNFDDCQRLVKKCLGKHDEKILLSSANSINIGRLLPQIVYYYYGYIQLVNNKEIKAGDKIDVVVPTGNFGNIFASYLAKSMGLPIDRFVCATNKNNVLEDFFKTGIYDANRKFYVTNSPSMDILVSSNLERLLSLLSKNEDEVNLYMKDLKEKKRFEVSKELKEKLKSFSSYSVNEEETLKAMKKSFEEDNYLIDPHTAVGYKSYLNYAKNTKNHVLIAATASFYKFPLAVKKALDLEENDEIKLLKVIEDITKVKIPSVLNNVIKSETPKVVITPEEFEKGLFKNPSFEIKVPASSANLGCGFDICGIALDLYNEYKFERGDQDELVGFDKSFGLNNNLVLKSYQYVFNKNHLSYQPVKITQVKNEVPESRGLGSSSTCIVAGILAANKILNDKYSDDDLQVMMVEMEGHPDNVVPCFKGEFVSSFYEDEKYYSLRSEVSDKLHFYVCIPDYKLSTEKARGVLPKMLERADAIYDASRLIALPKALSEGNLSLLKMVMKDKIHEPYRLKLIPEYEKIKDFSLKHGTTFNISGAGSTLLLISDNADLLKELKKIKTDVSYEYKELKVCHDGAKVNKEY